MEISDNGEDVTSTQKKLLQIVFDHFRSEGKWPRARIVQIEFATYGDFWAESENINHHFLRNRGSIDSPESVIMLSIDGIATCDDSGDMTALFLRSLEYCVTVYEKNPVEPIVTQNAIKATLSLNEFEASTALGLLFLGDGVWSSVSQSQDGTVTELKLYPRVFRYKGVTNIDQYLGIVRDNRVPPKQGIESSGTSRKLGRIKPESPLEIENIFSRNRKVFIVHGHDEKVKGSVARFVEHCGLEAVILHEQPSKGFTTPEKLEAHDDVGFAVVLLTPDDEGRSKNDELLQSRARQNVLIELGYFWGKLTRKRTHAIYVKGVEIPTDWENVIYTLFDEAGAWKQALFKELKEVWPDIKGPF